MTEKDCKPAIIESDASGETGGVLSPSTVLRTGLSKERNPQAPSAEQAFYEIKVKGHLDSHWSEWFDDLTVTHDESGNTILSGPVTDQAALHGLLIKVRDLGLTLLSVNRVEPDLLRSIRAPESEGGTGSGPGRGGGGAVRPA